LEPSVEGGLAIVVLSEPFAVLTERLAPWDRTSAIIELGILEKRLVGQS